jgi:hypothetical protein
MTQKSENINKFWKKSHKAVADSGVAESMPIWYVNWAQKFATSFRGKPLRSRSAGDVRRSPDSLT